MQVRPTRARRAVALAAIGALSIGIAACGSDSDDAQSSSTTEVTSDAAAFGLTVVEDGLADPAKTEELDLAAAASFTEISSPGAVMAVRTPKGTWIATIGAQDWDKTIPMTADVNQRVGSVTKTFTITALLQLAEQGKLSLDDPIEKYVPGMPNGDATLYELASMRSGIPTYTATDTFLDKVFSDPTAPWTPQELIDLVKGEEAMFAPGSHTFYSNTNTVLLGLVIEQVAGEPIQDVMQEQIFEPLGLDHTIFPTDAAFPDPHATGYTTQGTDDHLPVDATDWNPSWGWTAGAMISNVNDLLVWGKALSTGEGILSPETQAERINSFDFTIPIYTGEGGPTVLNSPERAYGLGLGLGLGWYGHVGELMGYNTVVQHNIDEDITIVVMVNSDIKSGACDADAPTTPGGRTTGPCDDPATHIANALAEAIGVPLVPAEVDVPATTSTTN